MDYCNIVFVMVHCIGIFEIQDVSESGIIKCKVEKRIVLRWTL